MHTVLIRDVQSGQEWCETVPAGHGSKWIDIARAALDMSVARGRLKDPNQPQLHVTVRVSTQQEIAARIEEMKLARALRFS